MKKVVAVPSDASEKNLKFYNQFEKSFKHFHPDVEVKRFDNPNPNDKDFWFRVKPVIAKQLFDQGYEMLILADNDQIVLGSLSDVLDDTEDYDVGVVLNDPTYPIQVWDITHPKYYNAGLVVLKSKEFADHWLKLCTGQHFNNYQFREQDFLTVLCSDYYNYKVKVLDNPAKVYGEVAKPGWIQARIEDGKVMIGSTQLCIYHSGGGSNSVDKGNYRLRFSDEVCKHIDGLIK